jgi:hypothetical protein
MNREQAIEIARECAKAKPQSYYAEPFEPHEWVIDAIMRAASAQETPAALPCVRREGCKDRARCAAEEHCTGLETRTEAAPEPPEATWICDCGRSNYVTVTRCEVCELRRNPERLALNRSAD